jgi:MFS family permease
MSLCIIGAGIAFDAPAFSSLLTDVVSEKELASASVLTGVQLDHSAIIGSALAGAVIPLIGTDIVFAVNSAALLASLCYGGDGLRNRPTQ